MNKRTSNASTVNKINSSQYSKSAAAQRSGMFYIEQSPTAPSVSKYSVGDLFYVAKDDHKEVTKGLNKWLHRLFSSDPDVCVQSEVDVKLCNAKEVFTSSTIRADVSVNSRSTKTTDMQFEVVSDGNRGATIWKLVVGLSFQLHHLRNGKNFIEKVAGFCVPVQPGYVEMIECKWSDDALLHMITVSCLDKGQVERHIKDVHREQCRIYSIKIGMAERLPLVLTPSFLHRVIGTDAVQYPSSQSIVIISNSKNCVYKRPFSELEIDRLRTLSKHTAIPYCALPTSIEDLEGKEYFKFEKYRQPLLWTEVRPFIADFVEKVVHTISELHQIGIAHLDIRLENICINKENLSPILIDLDRSRKADSGPPADLMYGESQMYKCGTADNWKCSNADWRQLAILIISITDSNQISGYHNLTTMPYHHQFIKTLFNQG